MSMPTTTSSTTPKPDPDLSVSIVLVCLYFTCALCMIVRLFQSKKRFRIGGLLIGLSMSRVVTFSIRAAWSTQPLNKNLAIAATVFLNAGVILLIITNMQLLIRFAKSLRPELQTSTTYRQATTAVQLFIIPVLIMTIVPAILSILTTNKTIKARDSIVIKISSTYITIYSLLPSILAPTLYFALHTSQRSIARRLHWKMVLIVLVSLLVGLEECLRCINNYIPATLSGWYDQKYAFYLFTPMLELLCLVLLIIIDLPHAFGDSNAAVLDILNGVSVDDEMIKVESDDKQALQDALAATTTTYRQGRWTRV